MAEIRVNATGELKLYDSDDSNYVSFKSAGTVSSNVAWVLPSADGSSGQMLSTNGSGTLSWATASSADPSSADGDSLGTASAEWSDLFLADGGTIQFGNDQDVTLTHVADTGLLLNSTMKLQFNDASQYIQGASATVLDIAATDEIELAATLVDLNGNLDVSGTTLLPTLGVVTAKDLGRGLHIRNSDSGASVQTNAGDLVIERNGDSGMTFLNSTSGESFINFGDSGDDDIGQIRYHHSHNRMQLHTNAVERLRIASDGEVSINDGFTDNSGTSLKVKGSVANAIVKLYHGSDSGSENTVVFFDKDVETCGVISINATNNTAAYGTSSDYRLKENETAITDGITRLKQLKPYRFNWKADSGGDKVDGFFAHEVSSIVPEAIHGEKDATTTDDDGKSIINPQQIDQAKLVPLLTAAMIELEARVKTLEG
jgi:hypothetical protein